MPKREGYLIEEIVERGNLHDSLCYVLRGKRKHSPCGRYMWKNKEKVIEKLQNVIADGSYRVTNYREHHINERGKERTIQCVHLFDRIALNAIMTVVERRLKPRLILNTAASIKGRGAHWLLHRLTSDMAKIPADRRIIYKNDIRKFYESIPQDLAMRVIRHYIKDKRLLPILDSCITLLPKGISIGLRSSQFIGLLVLTYVIDHKIKDGSGIAHYYRYCDDSVVITISTREARLAKDVSHRCVEAAGMEIKPNEQTWRHTHRPIDFLGFVIHADGNVRIRKHIKQRFVRRYRRIRSRRRRRELLASFYGICVHAHARHLFKTLTGIDMRDFKDFGLVYESTDGKKHYNCDTISLSELINVEVVVRDFETDVKTREGEGRYLVLIEKEGRERKFFTNSEEMKQMLDKVRKLYPTDGFPFATVIKRVSIGNGKFKYSFT